MSDKTSHASHAARIFTRVRPRDVSAPWEFEPAYSSGGSGWRLSPTTILTAAHVVADAEAILVCFEGRDIPVPAHVLCVDHERELALVQIDDISSVPEREISSAAATPKVGSDAVAVWYDHITRTVREAAGLVASVSVTSYAHTGRMLLAFEVRPVLPDGTSGAPVFDRQGQLLGIAFQGNDQSSDVVPTAIVSDFLRDYRASIRGVPDLGVHWQKLEHSALRQWFGARGPSGILITDVVPYSSAHGSLRRNDILVAVDKHPIENDGSVIVPDVGRLEFSYLVTRRAIGETLDLEVVRDRHSLEISVELRAYTSLVPLRRSSRGLSYFVFAGLVFRVLTLDYLSLWDWPTVAFEYKHFVYYADASEEQREIVIVSRVLGDDLTRPYERMSGMRVVRVNGVPIARLDDVVRATRRTVNGFHHVEVANRSPRIEDFNACDFGSHLVFDDVAVRNAHDRILKAHSITSDRSDDLPGTR